MKVVIYARTATTMQTNQRSNIRAQIKHCQKYARANALNVREVFADAGFSGTGLDRPALRRMRELIVRDRISAVIVTNLSRLTRSVVDLSTLQKEFGKRETHLHCAAQGSGDLTTRAIHADRSKRVKRA
ncbi:MAG: recombinase family protein [Chloroflexi bacterium]|nr:recombinase family protein [Chloroflexota bacterium]